VYIPVDIVLTRPEWTKINVNAVNIFEIFTILNFRKYYNWCLIDKVRTELKWCVWH